MTSFITPTLFTCALVALLLGGYWTLLSVVLTAAGWTALRWLP